MIIYPNQIRAARGLLDWTVSDLAKRAGVGTTTISSIETGKSAGSLDVLKNIYFAFRVAGVELTEEGGVIPTTNKIVILRGHPGFCAFFDDVYDVAKGAVDPNICVTNVDDKLFLQWHGERAPDHIKRMSELKISLARSLLQKGDNFRSATSYADYRWIDGAFFTSSSLYLYGHKAGIINFMPDDVEITVVNNPSTTQMLRSMFEALWEKSSREV
jgi:transcriptional regulator with XRE-family HTH domain